MALGAWCCTVMLTEYLKCIETLLFCIFSLVYILLIDVNFIFYFNLLLNFRTFLIIEIQKKKIVYTLVPKNKFLLFTLFTGRSQNISNQLLRRYSKH